MADTVIEGAMRDDTWEWSVYLDGVTIGVWDTKDGGEVDSDDNLFKPGGMADQYSLGGSVNVSNLTFSRNYRKGRDHPESQRLINRAGKGKIRAVGVPLDHDGVKFGKPFTYNGTLKRVAFPKHDSNSNAAAMVEIEVTVAGKPTAA